MQTFSRMQRDIFSQTHLILWTFLLVLSSNLIGTLFDLKLMFIGSAFLVLSYFLDTKNIFGQVFALFLFIIIEVNQGLYPLSSIAAALFIYLYMTPFFRQHLGCENCQHFINILLFYFVYFFLIWLFGEVSLTIFSYIALVIFNILIEFIFLIFLLIT
jgi:hypothetical protein